MLIKVRTWIDGVAVERLEEVDPSCQYVLIEQVLDPLLILESQPRKDAFGQKDDDLHCSRYSKEDRSL